MSSEQKAKWGIVIGAAEELDSKHESTISSDFVELKCCADCENMNGVITQWGNKFAKCREFGFVLRPNDPVIRCSAYYRKNQLSIHDMKEMATFIDVKRETGFIYSSTYKAQSDSDSEE